MIKNLTLDNAGIHLQEAIIEIQQTLEKDCDPEQLKQWQLINIRKWKAQGIEPFASWEDDNQLPWEKSK